MYHMQFKSGTKFETGRCGSCKLETPQIKHESRGAGGTGKQARVTTAAAGGGGGRRVNETYRLSHSLEGRKWDRTTETGLDASTSTPHAPNCHHSPTVNLTKWHEAVWWTLGSFSFSFQGDDTMLTSLLFTLSYLIVTLSGRGGR